MPLVSDNLTKNIPSLGVGLGYRSELREGILTHRESIDFLEIIVDNYLRDARASDARVSKELEELCALFPVIPHGVGLSIGSMMPLDRSYLQGMKEIADLTNAPYYSEHLCMTRVAGREIGHLAPLWFTEPWLQHVISNVLAVQDFLGRPLILENVTYFLDIPRASMSQAEFFQRLVEATGCGVLLDVTNVWINAVNHQFDPAAFLAQMPPDSLVQVHLAGGHWRGGWLVDSHSELVTDEMFLLLQKLASRCKIKGVLFEHDQRFPAMDLLLAQIQRAREIMRSGEASRQA